MNCKTIIFSTNATTRMFNRGISQHDVQIVLAVGEVIQSYTSDKPFPSFLLLTFINSIAFHVVASKDNDGNCIVITAYIPDTEIWDIDFKIKKK
jgi:Domain of unknown function (DUF4258)